MASTDETHNYEFCAYKIGDGKLASLKPKLDTIFAEVAKNLPDITFDGSDISSDDEVEIFQREANISHVDSPTFEEFDKEFNSLTQYDQEDSRSVKSAQTSLEPQHEASFTDKTLQNKPSDTAITAQRFLPKVNNWVQTSAEFKGNQPISSDDSDEGIIPDDGDSNHIIQPHDLKSELKLKKSRSAEESHKVVSKYITSSGPQLAFDQLSAIDIDEVLESIDGNGSNRLTEMIYDVSDEIQTPEDGGGEKLTVIERLAQLSSRHLGHEITDIDPSTGAICKKKPQTKEEKIAQNAIILTKDVQTTSQPRKTGPSYATSGTNTVTCSAGTSTNDLANYAKIQHSSPSTATTGSSNDRNKTIFIDLRKFDKEKKEQQSSIESVQRVLRIQQANSKAVSSSDDDDDDDVELWHEQRRRIKRSLTENGVVPDVLVTKASVPKYQPRNKRKPSTQRPAVPTGTPSSTNAESRDAPDPDIKTKALEVDRQRKLEAARKLREQKENQLQSRIRLGKRLEALRPSISVNGKQSMAETTPTMYHQEASYEPALNNLPFNLSDSRECCLLTILLSSNGEIITHRGTSNKSVDPGNTLSATYTSLLTWLLALVPGDFTFLQESAQPSSKEVAPTSPFHVVGLQQMWQDEQLKLIVAVTPRVEVKTPVKSRKIRKARGEGSTPFQQQLIKYLSTNTLHSVSPWLANLVSLDITDRDAENSYRYRPPLPSITMNPLSTFMQINPNLDAVQKIFNNSIAFFWQTIENDEFCFDFNIVEENIAKDTQNTMSLVYRDIFTEPTAMMGILNRVLQEGLDIAGIRLVYPSTAFITADSGGSALANQGDLETLNNIGPILAVAIRGSCARTIWLDALGPSDPILARKTDPNSLCALYGGETRDNCLLFCPRTATRINVELVSWFSARVPPSGVIDVGVSKQTKQNRQSSCPKSTSKSKKVTFADLSQEIVATPSRPAALLTATCYSDIFIVMSALLPTSCLGLIMLICQRRGFAVRGIKRIKLTSKKASCLGLSGQQISVFSSASVTSPTSPNDKMFEFNDVKLPENNPCNVLLLRKENALHHSASLIEAFMVQMSLIGGILGRIEESIDLKLSSGLLFHAAGYSESLINKLGGELSKVPNDTVPSPSYIAPKLYSNPELEQVVVIALTGHQMMKSMGLFLAKLLDVVPKTVKPSGQYIPEPFELLGLKWLPGLSPNQARELTPYEVGDKRWKKSIHTLSSEPALIIVVRGVNGLQRVQNIIVPKSIYEVTKTDLPLDKMMSPTPELAYFYATMFFHECELWSDDAARPLLPYLPPPRYNLDINDKDRRTRKIHLPTDDELILQTMLMPVRPLCSLLMIKPDAVRHFAKILRRIDTEGFRIIALKFEVLSLKDAEFMLTQDDEKEDGELSTQVEHLTSGQCILLVLQRENAVKRLVDLLGPNDPQQAKRLSQFNWRGVFGTNNIANGLHCSVTYRKSVEELIYFFPEGVCSIPNIDLIEDKITCPAVDPLVSLDLFRCRRLSLKAPEPGLISSSMSHTDTTLHISSLMQSTCIVLPPCVLTSCGKSTKHAYVEIVDGLLSHGFQLVGCKMLQLTQNQAENFCHLISAGSFTKVPMLMSGPSLILALQRDNAVMGFDGILSSCILLGESLNNLYGDSIMRPNDVNQAERLLLYFFDRLIGGAQAEIHVSP